MKKRAYQIIPLSLGFLLLLTACGSAAQGAGEYPVQSSLLTVSAAQTTPDDQPSPWATANLERARSLGLVTDEMNQGFQSTTTRAEFCRLVSRMLIIFYEAPIDYIIEARGLTPHDFNDTTDYAIRAAAALGVTSGNGSGDFLPDQPLTREQAATMLRNVMDAIDLETENYPIIAWTDTGEIETWARDATDVMYTAKIMNGTSTQALVFSPKTPYSREQALIAVLNLWDHAMDQGTSRELPNVDINYGKPDSSGTATPEPAPDRTYNMDDPNVQKYPIYATARSAAELQAGSLGWHSAAEVIAEQKRDHEDYLIDGMTFYEWRMAPIQAWVDGYVSANGLSYTGKTDFEKTAIIRHVVESGRLEELIGLWRPNFKFTTDDCVPLAEAVEFMMIAMDFGMFKSVPCTVNLPHATNGYWDSTVGAIRFIDANLGFDVWNIFVDELYEKGFKLH